MEYVQERIVTLHDFGEASPESPTANTTVVVPMTAREHASLAAERVLERLEQLTLERVLVALRADAAVVPDVYEWLTGYDLPVEVLWCTAPPVLDHLAAAGLDGPAGKGRDVWLALGVAAASEYVVVHDADARQYEAAHVSRLLFPLARGKDFSKGYYARIENGRLYGRLFRLFYRPLLAALRDRFDDDIIQYLSSFRYGLAGEFAMTSALARQLRAPPGWGFEVGSLGEVFATTGFGGTAQVDLGIHEHEHRSVGGPQGLGDMCTEVAGALFRVLEDHGLSPDYEVLEADYRTTADSVIDAYAMDAAFNDLAYDPPSEREQVATYAASIGPPGPDRRLPAWDDAPISAEDVRSLSADALAATTEP